MMAPQPPQNAVVIDDDPDVLRLLVQVLDSAGFATHAFDNGLEGIEGVKMHAPVITTVDVTMPGIDGIETARRIRGLSDTYILMISALDDEADLVLALGAGADDYITKPFRPREIRARIEAMQRRPRHTTSSEVAASRVEPTRRSESSEVSERRDERAEQLRHGELVVDPWTRIVHIGSEEVSLTRTEFDLLYALLSSGQRVRSKADLALVARGDGYSPSSLVSAADRRAIEVHITNLRRKLDDSASDPTYIETVRGIGYRMAPPA